MSYYEIIHYVTDVGLFSTQFDVVKELLNNFIIDLTEDKIYSFLVNASYSDSFGNVENKAILFNKLLVHKNSNVEEVAHLVFNRLIFVLNSYGVCECKDLVILGRV